MVFPPTVLGKLLRLSVPGWQGIKKENTIWSRFNITCDLAQTPHVLHFQ
jgi:hypothetical protein